MPFNDLSRRPGTTPLLLLLSALLLLPVLGAGCKYLPWTREAKPAATCLSEPSEIKSKEFGVGMALAGRLKATLLAVTNLQKLAKTLDKSTSKTCRELVFGLGGKKPTVGDKYGAGTESTKACKVAAQLVRSLREKTNNALLVDEEPLRCAQAPEGYERCARDCDPNVGRDNSKVSCVQGTEIGRCGGKCTGSCMTSYAECNGTCGARCSGACSEGFEGQCGGRCSGTCDGESIKNRVCKGKCEGTCKRDASGSCSGVCKGECGGTCLMDMSEKASKCGGDCDGTCSEDMTRVRCGEVVLPPEMGDECRARCETESLGSLRCEKPVVRAEIYGEVDPEAGAKLSKHLPIYLPELFKVRDVLKLRLEGPTNTVQTSLTALRSELNDDKTVKAKIGTCVAAAERAAEEALTGLSTSIEAAESTLAATKD